jgi:hypothetical protein
VGNDGVNGVDLWGLAISFNLSMEFSGEMTSLYGKDSRGGILGLTNKPEIEILNVKCDGPCKTMIKPIDIKLKLKGSYSYLSKDAIRQNYGALFPQYPGLQLPKVESDSNAIVDTLYNFAVKSEGEHVSDWMLYKEWLSKNLTTYLSHAKSNYEDATMCEVLTKSELNMKIKKSIDAFLLITNKRDLQEHKIGPSGERSYNGSDMAGTIKEALNYISF